jgi:hypothetical protein
VDPEAPGWPQPGSEIPAVRGRTTEPGIVGPGETVLPQDRASER